MEEQIQLVVGLGNPGAEYLFTRHNVGFWFVDALARNAGASFQRAGKFHGDTARARIVGHELRLLKPNTFMNRSGQAVHAIAAYLKLAPASILIVHDDLDLPAGTARLKWGGGHGGHNGLRDIINHLGRDFRRLRIGIGHPSRGADVINYVLKRPGRGEEDKIMAAVGAGLEVIPRVLEDGLEAAMRALHRKETEA